MMWYIYDIQLTGKEELQRMDEPCVLSGGAQECVSWQLIETAHDFVLPSWKIRDWKHAKQYKAKMELFFPFPGSFK